MLELLDLPETDYLEALALQEHHRQRVAAGAPDVLLLLSHPPTVTLGRNASEAYVVAPEWLASRGARVVRTDRGGEVTWHGPGQLVGYPIVSLTRARLGVKPYVTALARGLLEVLSELGVDARWEPDTPGLWTSRGKVAAFGVRVQGGVTTHGFALNLDCDLDWYSAIVPCGLSRGATSVAAEGIAPPPASVLRPRVHAAIAAALFGSAPTLE